MSGAVSSPAARHTVIEATRGWRVLDLRELWAYRDLLWVLASRDIKVRYRQTILGAAWAVLKPVATMAIFTVVFGGFVRVPSEGYPYAVFVYAGLLPWTFFSNAITGSATSVVTSSPLITKVYFPRLIVPLASLGVCLVDALVSALVLLLLMRYYGVAWRASLFATPLVLLAIAMTALGVGVLFSALTVAYRDFTHLVPFVLQIWMYATPVIYPPTVIPRQWKWLVHLNPMAGLIQACRATFLGRPLDWDALSISGLAAVAFLGLGMLYFRNVERRFADIV